jgi:putative nucleotidyltransferase-like protein
MREDTASAALGPETALLVACTRAHVDPFTAARVRELAGAVRDWHKVLELGRRHRLVPLLYTHLKAVAEDVVPHEAYAALREEFTTNAAKNLALAVELLAVTELLDSHGIRALPYKGPTLAQCIYGSLAARQMKDVDILVRPADLDRAVSLLATREYSPVTPVLPGARRLGLEYQCVLTRPSDETIIELHWSVVPRTMAPPVTLDHLWPSRLHTAMLGRTLPSPSHEDTLVILGIHGSKHQWARLEWICGVAELLRSKPLDWLKVLARAERWHATRMLSTGLLLAVDVLDAPVPEAVVGVARRDVHVVALAASARERLFVDEGPTIDRRVLRAFQLGSQEGVRDKARYVWFRPLIAGARQGARFAHWLQEVTER